MHSNSPFHTLSCFYFSDDRTQAVYELRIECRDGGHGTSLMTTRNLTVFVSDAGPDAPVFSEQIYLATLIEQSPLATVVLTVSATDRNGRRRAAVVYSLDSDVTRELQRLRYACYCARSVRRDSARRHYINSRPCDKFVTTAIGNRRLARHPALSGRVCRRAFLVWSLSTR